MDDVLYVAMNGAKSAMQLQNINANNLANVKTTGFQADLYQAESVTVVGDTFPTQAYAVLENTLPDLTPGPVMTTGRELDIAIKGDGFIAVQDPSGQERYTRAGDLQIDANGLLTTGAGYPVLGNGGPIAIPPAEKIEIGGDGTISILPVGQENAALATLDRIKLVNPDKKDLHKTETGLLALKDGQLAVADANVRVVSGALNGSNVNGVASMLDMITAARQFEMSMKLIQEIDQTTEVTAQLLQLS